MVTTTVGDGGIAIVNVDAGSVLLISCKLFGSDLENIAAQTRR